MGAAIQVGVAIAGAVIAGVQAVNSANENARERTLEEAEAKRNLKLAQAARADALNRGAIASALPKREAAQLAARQRSAYTHSGVDSSVGTAADVVASTMALGEYESLVIQNNAAREAWGFTQTANKLNRLEGYNAIRAQNRQTATILGGVSDFTSSVARAASFTGGGASKFASVNGTMRGY